MNNNLQNCDRLDEFKKIVICSIKGSLGEYKDIISKILGEEEFTKGEQPIINTKEQAIRYNEDGIDR